MIFVLLIVQNLLTYKETEGLEISSLVQLCNAKDPQLSDCIKEAAQKFIPHLAEGITDWNIPSLDPLTAPLVVFKNTNGGNTLQLEYRNVVQTGFSSGIVENVKEIDLDRGIMDFKLKFPCITFLADYTSKGKMLNLDFKGQGKSNTTAWNASSGFMINYHMEADHIKLNSVKFTLSFDKIYLDYPNLMINGKQELSKTANSFLNDNAGAIMGGLKSQMEEFYEEIMSKALQNLFDSVPYSALFKSV